MRSLSAALLALAVAGSNACTESPSESRKVVEIDHYAEPCVGGETQMLCLRGRTPGSQDYVWEYDAVEGFTWRWGHRYTIEEAVTVFPGAPPADGTNVRAQLVKILKDEPVPAGTTFDLITYFVGPGWAEFVASPADGGGRLLDGTPFTCASPELCAELARRLAGHETLRLTFGYAPELLPLVLTAAVPAPAR
jgi:hypothetical protein